MQGSEEGSEVTGSAVHCGGGGVSHDTALKEHLMPRMLTFITNAKGSPQELQAPTSKPTTCLPTPGSPLGFLFHHSP